MNAQPFKIAPYRGAAMARQRGVTMVSVMLLTVSLLTVGLLAIRSSVREVSQAGQMVARERAMMVAEAAVDLATARLRELDDVGLDGALAGQNAGTCANPCEDCIPGQGAGALITGRRNEVIAGSGLSCGGRPCMRPGALVVLPTGDGSGTDTRWCKLPFRSIVTEGDPEAYVSVWVRNNTADVLATSGSGSWTDDSDTMVTVTAQVEIRNTVVAVEQEVRLQGAITAGVGAPESADEGYGGGHNNDNSTVAICTDDFQSATTP